jgi:hypothetical protein
MCVSGVELQALEPRQLLAVDLAATYGVLSYNTRTGVISSTATINNFGNSAVGTYKIRWFLSRDTVVNNADDIPLKELTLSGSPAPGRSITRSDPVTVSYSTPAGAYFVGFAVDVDNKIVESNDFNNYQFTSSPSLALAAEPISYLGTVNREDVRVIPGQDSSGRPQLLLVVNGSTTRRVNPYRAGTIQISTLAGDDSISIAADITNPANVDGGLGNDVIVGGAGADTLYGNGGNDTVYGGADRDLLKGGAGNDRLLGQADSDRLYGNAGNDYLDGGVGNDRLWGDTGVDQLFGNVGNDTLYGHDSTRELLSGGNGTDSAQRDPIDVLSSVERILP